MAFFSSAQMASRRTMSLTYLAKLHSAWDSSGSFKGTLNQAATAEPLPYAAARCQRSTTISTPSSMTSGVGLGSLYASFTL